MSGGTMNTDGTGVGREWEQPVRLTNPSKGQFVPFLLAIAISLASTVVLVLAFPMH